MSFTSFISDRNASRKFGDWLFEFYPKNPSGVETPIYVSRRGTISPPSNTVIGSDTILANTLYKRRVLQAPTMTQSLWAPGQVLSSSSIPSFGSTRLQNKDGGLDNYMPSQGWTWAGCRFKSFYCDKRTRYVASTIGKVADGIMGDPQFGLGTVDIPLLGRESLFDVALSTHVYRGTGYMLELFGDRTVSFGTPAAVGITGSFTIEGWLWLDALPNAAVGFWAWIGGTQRPWGLVVNSTGTLTLNRTFSGVTESKATTLALAAQKFYHFAFSVSGAVPTFVLWDDDLQLESIETLSSYSSAVADAVAGSTYALRSGSNATFRPWCDEFRVRNVALTPDQIRADRFREIASGSIPASVVHYPRFNDGSGTTVVDSSATAANGTISGAGTSTWLHSQEGGPELAGTPKPYVSGEKFGCAPVLVDGVRQGYQVAGGGAIQDVTSFEGALGHTMIASAANFRTYLTTTPAAGTSLRYLPRGLFKLGSSPTLPIAATVKGYNGGALGYVDKGGTVTRDIVTRRGPKLVDPTDLDTAAFTAYATANPGIIGLSYASPGDDVTIHSALDSIMRSGAGWWGWVRASTLFHLEKYAGPAVAADYNFTQTRIFSITPIDIPAVIYQVVVRYRENHVVLSEDQVAATVKGTASWHEWTKQWKEKPATDSTLRAQFPGKASIPITFDTLLQYDEDAQNLANYVLALIKGKKEAWEVTVDATGLQVKMGQTCTLAVELRLNRQRLKLYGDKNYVILTVTDTKQDGKVTMQVLGDASV